MDFHYFNYGAFDALGHVLLSLFIAALLVALLFRGDNPDWKRTLITGIGVFTVAITFFVIRGTDQATDKNHRLESILWAADALQVVPLPDGRMKLTRPARPSEEVILGKTVKTTIPEETITLDELERYSLEEYLRKNRFDKKFGIKLPPAS